MSAEAKPNTPPEPNSLVEYAIRIARHQAWKRHGPLTKDPVRAVGILTEEVGESMAEALELTRPNTLRDKVRLRETRNRLKEEVAQVAATAINILMNLEEEQFAEFCNPVD